MAVIAWLMLITPRALPLRPARTDQDQARCLPRGCHARTPKEGSSGDAPTTRNNGQRVHKTPGLSAVYASENLPPAPALDELPEGEKRMLRSMNLESLPGQLQAIRCRTCRKREPNQKKRFNNQTTHA